MIVIFKSIIRASGYETDIRPNTNEILQQLNGNSTRIYNNKDKNETLYKEYGVWSM
jgi:calcineurin-like phosphoesterase family protein